MEDRFCPLEWQKIYNSTCGRKCHLIMFFLFFKFFLLRLNRAVTLKQCSMIHICLLPGSGKLSRFFLNVSENALSRPFC